MMNVDGVDDDGLINMMRERGKVNVFVLLLSVVKMYRWNAAGNKFTSIKLSLPQSIAHSLKRF